MAPYEKLAEGRRVIFYDQLGCGRSAVDEPHNSSLWTVGLYLEEIDTVRESLGLERCHVLGHSWGGMLAMAYAAKRPNGLAGLVVQSAPASVPYWMSEIDRLRAGLPVEVEATLRRHERDGTTDDEEYQEAMMVFYDRHVCRVRPWPDWLQATFDALAKNPEVYLTMNGPSEFHVIGSLKDFDVSATLARSAVPTLLFCGEFDEVTPTTVRQPTRPSPDRSFWLWKVARTWHRQSARISRSECSRLAGRRRIQPLAERTRLGRCWTKAD